MRNTWPHLLTLVIVVAVIIMFSTGTFAGIGLKRSCKAKVRTMLRSPATAEFSNGPKGVGLSIPAVARGEGGTRFYFGAVDSQNGFGAMLRSYYVCTDIAGTGVLRVSLVDDDADSLGREFEAYVEAARR